LSLEPASVQVLTEWFHFGSLVLDELVATTPAVGEATTAQLWPEHFDLGITVTVGGDRAARVNIGASPGDDWEPLPYLYVGPHDPNRPGDPSYWNASFGAVLRYEELADLRPADRLAGAISFAGRGLALLHSQ